MGTAGLTRDIWTIGFWPSVLKNGFARSLSPGHGECSNWEWDFAGASSRGQPTPLCLKLFGLFRFPEEWTSHIIVFIGLFCQFAGNTLDPGWEVWKGGC